MLEKIEMEVNVNVVRCRECSFEFACMHSYRTTSYYAQEERSWTHTEPAYCVHCGAKISRSDRKAGDPKEISLSKEKIETMRNMGIDVEKFVTEWLANA